MLDVYSATCRVKFLLYCNVTFGFESEKREDIVMKVLIHNEGHYSQDGEIGCRAETKLNLGEGGGASLTAKSTTNTKRVHDLFVLYFQIR